MPDVQSIFAANVRKIRKELHLSQEKLAELSGLHRTYIGGIEQRRVNVSLKNIGKIANALDVDPSVLFLSEEACLSKKEDKSKAEANVSESTAQEAPDDAGFLNQSSGYALVSWKDGRVVAQPVEIKAEDATMRLLSSLVQKTLSAEDPA